MELALARAREAPRFREADAFVVVTTPEPYWHQDEGLLVGSARPVGKDPWARSRS